jgi:hypothetical protein
MFVFLACRASAIPAKRSGPAPAGWRPCPGRRPGPHRASDVAAPSPGRPARTNRFRSFFAPGRAVGTGHHRQGGGRDHEQRPRMSFMPDQLPFLVERPLDGVGGCTGQVGTHRPAHGLRAFGRFDELRAEPALICVARWSSAVCDLRVVRTGLSTWILAWVRVSKWRVGRKGFEPLTSCASCSGQAGSGPAAMRRYLL